MSALQRMLDQLGIERTGHYVTRLPEAKAILSELSELVPVGVHKEETYDPDLVGIKLTIGFHLSRAETYGPLLPTRGGEEFTAVEKECEARHPTRVTFVTLVGGKEPVYMAEGSVDSVYTRDEIIKQFTDIKLGGKP